MTNFYNCDTYRIPKCIWRTLLHHGGYDQWEKMLVKDDNYYFRNYATGKTLCVCPTKKWADYNITDYTVLVRHPDEITDNGKKAHIRGMYLLRDCWNAWYPSEDFDSGFYAYKGEYFNYQIIDHKPVDWELWKYAPDYGIKELWFYDPEQEKWTFKVIYPSDGESIKL